MILILMMMMLMMMMILMLILMWMWMDFVVASASHHSVRVLLFLWHRMLVSSTASQPHRRTEDHGMDDQDTT